MNYFLDSRFQGAWLGAMVGEAAVQNHQHTRASFLNYQPSSLLSRAVATNQALTKSFDSKWQSQAEILTNSSEAALAIFPLILFYHENMSLLAEKLKCNALVWHYANKVVEDVLIWGYALALILREKLDTRSAIEQILVGVGAKQTVLGQQLERVAILINKGSSLRKVEEELLSWEQSESEAIAPSGAKPTAERYRHLMGAKSPRTRCYPLRPIPLSLYCFCSTPTNYSLCVRRAISTGYFPEITAALTGILAGAYNGIVGIPLSWRLAIQTNPNYQLGRQQAQLLWQAWSGVYQPERTHRHQTAVASAGRIQSRPSLSIISQKEQE